MYTISQIKEKLNEKTYFVDETTILKFLKNWKVEAIYEDENGEEFYDDVALEKIFKGMELKTKGESDRKIAFILNEGNEIIKNNLPQKVETLPHEDEKTEEESGAELKKFSLDITNQTISFLAETIAQKITSDVTDHIKESDMMKNSLEIDSLQKDNGIMAKQIKDLLEENKKLITKLSALKFENEKYKHVFGKFYVKEEK